MKLHLVFCSPKSFLFCFNKHVFNHSQSYKKGFWSYYPQYKVNEFQLWLILGVLFRWDPDNEVDLRKIRLVDLRKIRLEVKVQVFFGNPA